MDHELFLLVLRIKVLKSHRACQIYPRLSLLVYFEFILQNTWLKNCSKFSISSLYYSIVLFAWLCGHTKPELWSKSTRRTVWVAPIQKKRIVLWPKPCLDDIVFNLCSRAMKQTLWFDVALGLITCFKLIASIPSLCPSTNENFKLHARINIHFD